jgi:hypothetical protein
MNVIPAGLDCTVAFYSRHSKPCKQAAILFKLNNSLRKKEKEKKNLETVKLSDQYLITNDISFCTLFIRGHYDYIHIK